MFVFHGVHEDARRQLSRVGSLLAVYGAEELNSLGAKHLRPPSHLAGSLVLFSLCFTAGELPMESHIKAASNPRASN